MEVFAFHDLLEPGPTARVLARVHFLSSSEGGRASPVSGVYGPTTILVRPMGGSFMSGKSSYQMGLRYCRAIRTTFTLHFSTAHT